MYSDLKDIKSWLHDQKERELLRFLTCGNVDDGKSTLIGRLLYDTNQIYEDHLTCLKKTSKRHGTQGKELDLALLTDGLQAEIEQGITIDVAYRYFSTKKRKFIIADTPGHQQYTRNMATGASTSDLAILLIDARKGVLEQTRMHSFICTLLGIRHLLIAINKMDLVHYKKETFDTIKKSFLHFSNKLPQKTKKIFIPISALTGENIVFVSNTMRLWYSGPTLLELLENINIKQKNKNNIMRFPVQYINRPNLNFRGYSGTIASGNIHIGKKIKILPSGIHSTVAQIVTFDGELKKAQEGQAITIVLKDEVDISRGDLIVNFDNHMPLIRKASVHVVWMSEDPICVGKQYHVKIFGKKILAHIDKILYQIDTNNLKPCEATHLPLNGIGVIDITFNELIAIDKYCENKMTGSMIFIDCINNLTVGAGMVKDISKFLPIKTNLVKNFEIELKSLIQRYFPH